MKTEENFFTRMMTMNDAVWARHANPWSVWTRVVTGLPAILLAVWSIRILGWWSVVVIVGACLWLWLNPRLFPIPFNTRNWASQVTFGERVWLNRQSENIPTHHIRWAKALSWISGIGFIAAVYGAVQHHLIYVLVGGTVSWFGKMWLCDRMVWLYQDMQDVNETYKSWLKGND